MDASGSRGGQRADARLLQRLQALEDELSTALGKQDEQRQRLSDAQADLEGAEAEVTEEQRRRGVLQSLRGDVTAAQQALRDLVTEAKARKERFAQQQQQAEQQPHDALDVIRELTKDREQEISNSERQLRETRQIILMKEARQKELQAETDKKMSAVKEEVNQDVLSLVEKCQRERQDLLNHMAQLKGEMEDQRQSLMHKNHKQYRHMSAEDKKQKLKRDVPVRQQVQVTRKASASQGAGAQGANGTLVVASKDIVATKQHEVATQALGEQVRNKDSLRRQVREEEALMAKLEVDHKKLKRDLEYRIHSERVQAEQFERENQKLEQQAEYLEKMMKSLKKHLKGTAGGGGARPSPSPRALQQGTPRGRIL
eukprot:TRINITY_DN789_c0_g2_i1.p1 TRINITY_DN789_c0_g2~~TRINITY_DN789_c0_g2_i1.p1  ORF type:complete len:407 (+),score=173.53 TRINITY_DN789_c0_g2_i1:111-1223(+)